jgi:hypothetical protein
MENAMRAARWLNDDHHNQAGIHPAHRAYDSEYSSGILMALWGRVVALELK